PQRVAGSPNLDPVTYLQRIGGSLFFGATHNETLSALPVWTDALAFLLLALAAGAAALVLARRTMWAWLMASFALVPLAVTYVFMLCVPVFATRYVLGALPPLLGIIAAGWSALSTRPP